MPELRDCLETPTDDSVQGAAFDRVKGLLEWPMMVLAVLFVAALIVEDNAQIRDGLRGAARVVDVAIWTAFLAEYVLLFVLARRRHLYIRTHLLDLAVVVLPALRFIRVLRLLRITRGLRALRLSLPLLVMARQWSGLSAVAQRRGIPYILTAIALLVLCGAYVMFRLEGNANQGFASYGKSLWWALVTVSTVGYGDASPTSMPGRSFAALFMLLGVATFGTVSALVAAYFVGLEQEDEHKAVMARLEGLEASLRRIEKMLEKGTGAPPPTP